jgi:type IV secretory pathway TrbF-like protein
MAEPVEERPPDRYARPRVTQGERLRSPVVEAHRWRLFALLALVGFLGTTGSTVYFAARRTVEVFPITIDQDNHVRAIGPLDVPEDRQMLAIKRDLTQVVEWIRTVPADPDLLKLNWWRAMQFMSPQGGEMLKQYGRELRPDELQKTWRVRVQVKNIQPVMRDSYFVDWEERYYKLPDMSLRQVKRYLSVISFTMTPPTHGTEEARLNWMGLKIHDVTWYQQPDFSPKPVITRAQIRQQGGSSDTPESEVGR